MPWLSAGFWSPFAKPLHHMLPFFLAAVLPGATVPATPAMSGVVWAAVKHSAKVIAATNALGFAVTAVTQSHKITDLTGTAAFAASAWATHAASARCGRAAAAAAAAAFCTSRGRVALLCSRSKA